MILTLIMHCKTLGLEAPGCQREYESRAAVNTVVLHPNKTELISADQNGNILVWDLRANPCSCELVPRSGYSSRTLDSNVGWKPDSFRKQSRTCYIWRLLQGTQTMTIFKPLHKLLAHDGYILKCLISPEFCEPNRLGSMTFSYLKNCFILHLGFYFEFFSLFISGLECLGFIPRMMTFRYLATASSDHTIKIWNADRFALEKTLTGHQCSVWDCVFSVDGAFLIIASSDSTARLWSMSNGEEIEIYEGHRKATVYCAFHDGNEPSS